jgi:hypothetical protein
MLTALKPNTARSHREQQKEIQSSGPTTHGIGITLGAHILGVEFLKADRAPRTLPRAEHNPFQSSSLVK